MPTLSINSQNKGSFPHTESLRIMNASQSLNHKTAKAAETAQQVRMPAALAVEPGLVPSTYSGSELSRTEVAGNSAPSSDLCGHHGACNAQTCMHATPSYALNNTCKSIVLCI